MGGARVDAYVADRVTSGELATSSAEVIRVVLRHWERHVDERPPMDWTMDDVAGWVNDQALRPSTRKSRLTKLRPYVRWLMEQDELLTDPTRRIRRISVPKGDPRNFDAIDMTALIAACPDTRALLIVVVMAQMGIRCGDLARARIEDIDSRRHSLHVRAKGGRGEHTHWEPIPDEAWSLLVPWILSLGRSYGPVIENVRRPGEAVTPAHLSKLVGRWVRAAGLKAFPYDGASAHSLRHTCAQDMLDKGATMRDVQYTLGHATSRSTEIYTRREPHGLREAINGRSYLAA